MSNHTAKGRYLGGHPAATSPTRKATLTLDDTALKCENPTLRIPLEAIESAQATAPVNDRKTDYRFSPTAGLLGGFKANNQPETLTGMSDAFDAQMKRELQVTYRDEAGDLHTLRFSRTTMNSRTRKDTRADMRAGDPNGISRFAREILAARLPRRTAP